VWSDLSRVVQRTNIAGGVAEIVLTAWALRDLKRRPAKTVHDPSVRAKRALTDEFSAVLGS